MRAWWLCCLPLVCLPFLAACPTRWADPPDGDGGPPPDAALLDGDPCACSFDPADQRPVQIFHACTPPLQEGCAATVCEPGVTDCGPGFTCEPCSAAACCICAACLPSCVFTGPAQGPLPEYLKLRAVSGPANEKQELVVEGFPFYIGALFYLARIGDSGDLPESSYPGTCSHGFRAPARAPGTYPVWVSQYGGGEPWVLAGFFTYTNDLTPSCAQPGLWCGPDTVCCQTADVPMVCRDGRCQRP